MEKAALSTNARIFSARGYRETAPILVEPTLFYNPPYEHPLEDEFAWHLVKYLDPKSALGYQVKFDTPVANLWVDFVVEIGARRIGFECSTFYEDENELALRDALLVGSGALHTLYRLRGVDVMYRLHDVLYLISQIDRTLFSARGRINLETLASAEAHECRVDPDSSSLSIVYRPVEDEDEIDGEAFSWPSLGGEESTLYLRRLDHRLPDSWVRDYYRALAYFDNSVDRMSEQWAKTA